MKRREFFGYIASNWPAKVLSIGAAILLFLFYRSGGLEQRFFNVPLNVLVNDNYIPAGSYPLSARIILRGNQNDIYHISEEDIEVFADFSNHKSEGSFRAAVQFTKKGTALYIDPLEIKVDPLDVTISLERKITKSVEVFPTLGGFEKKGYELVHYFLSPTSVKVTGPRSHVEGINAIQTREIDLTDRSENFTIMVRLDNEDMDIAFPGGDVIEFHGVIQETTILKTFTPVDFITLDLAEDLTFEKMPSQGFIKIQTTQLSLEKMNVEDFRLIIDCSGISLPGEYTIPVEPDVPSGVLLLKYDPVEITLKFMERGE